MGQVHIDNRSKSLSSSLLAALHEVGTKLDCGDELGAELGTALELISDLPPNQVARVDTAIAAAAGLYRRTLPSVF